jgi:carbon monoxide dehydrogenase subunit G
MEFDNAFEVPLPPGPAWAVLMDIERVAPCMPGATLTEKVDDRGYKGKVGVRLGPVSLSFAGVAKFEEIDDANFTARVSASGTDAKGRGGANSKVTFRVEPSGTGSQVLVHTELSLSGAVAQYGRGAGMIQEVSAQLIKQFAASLRALIEADMPAAPAEAPVVSEPPANRAEPVPASPPRPFQAQPAKPISGFSLMLRVLWSSIRRLFSSAQT